MSYVKLMQANGTTLPDTSHSLCVYRLEPKKWDESDNGYLSLPCTKGELKNEKKEEKHGALVLSTKDSFFISTNVCSTKLTQNGNFYFKFQIVIIYNFFFSGFTRIAKLDR